MVIIDTSIIIDHLRASSDAETILMKLAQKYKRNELAISILTIQELYEGKSTLNKEKEAYMISTISPLLIHPYNYQIAKRAGELARDINRPIELADAGIAATALEHNACIATLNVKDFKDINSLELEDLTIL